MRVDVLNETRIDQVYHAVKYVIFKGWAYSFIGNQLQVVVPLYDITTPGCVVDDVGSILLLESTWSHRGGVIFESSEVHEVYSFLCNIVILPDFVEYPLQGCGVSNNRCVVIQ